jgi:hypothetical protein
VGKSRATGDALEAGAKVFPIGKLLRPAKGLRSGADEAAVAARRGVDPPTRARRLTQEESWAKARQARDDAHTDLVRKKQRLKEIQREKAGPPKPDRERMRALNAEEASYKGLGKAETVTAATDPETGITKAGWNHKPTPPERWGCAEKMALDEINAERTARGLPKLDAKDVDFSEARYIEPDGSYRPKPIDGWCQNKTDPDQYPNDVQYYEHDSSGLGNGWDTRFGI